MIRCAKQEQSSLITWTSYRHESRFPITTASSIFQPLRCHYTEQSGHVRGIEPNKTILVDFAFRSATYLFARFQP